MKTYVWVLTLLVTDLEGQYPMISVEASFLCESKAIEHYRMVRDRYKLVDSYKESWSCNNFWYKTLSSKLYYNLEKSELSS